MGVAYSGKRCQSKPFPMAKLTPHWLAAYMLGSGMVGIGAVIWGALKK